MKEVDLGANMLALRYLIPRYLILATYTCLARYKNRREAVIEALQFAGLISLLEVLECDF